MMDGKTVKRILIFICFLLLIIGLFFLLITNVESDFEKKAKELSQQYDVSRDEVKFLYDMSGDWELVTDQLESTKKTEERKQIEKTRVVELLNNSGIRLFLEEEIYSFGDRVSIVYDKTCDNILSFCIDDKEKELNKKNKVYLLSICKALNCDNINAVKSKSTKETRVFFGYTVVDSRSNFEQSLIYSNKGNAITDDEVFPNWFYEVRSGI